MIEKARQGYATGGQIRRHALGIRRNVIRQARGLGECAGGPAPVAIAIEMIAPRGTIMLMSAPPEPIVFSQWEVMLKEAVLRTAIMYSRAEFEEAVALLATGKVRSDAVPVTIFPLNEAPRALTELLMRGTPPIKVLLTP